MTNSMTLRVFFLLILVQIVTSANGRTLDEQAFSQVATINISNTQFPQGITIRGVGTRPFGLVGALIANQVGDADPTKQISEDITTAFRSALISYVEKAGYGTLTDSFDASLTINLIEFGYAKANLFSGYKPQITADVKIVGKNGKVILEDYIAVGNNLSTARWSGPRVVGTGNTEFASSDDIDANPERARKGLDDTFVVFLQGIGLPKGSIKSKEVPVIEIKKLNPAGATVGAAPTLVQTPSLAPVITPAASVMQKDAANASVPQKLRELQSLLRDGVITESEFNAKKKAFLEAY